MRVFVALVLLIAVPPLAASATTYSVTAFQIAGTDASASDINSAGQVVGTYHCASGQNHAFVYQSGTFTDLTPSSSVISYGVAVNESGQTAGYYAVGGILYGCMWDNTGQHTVPITGGGAVQARAINDQGWVVGSASTGSGGYAWLWDGSTVTTIDGLSGRNNSYATGINSSGAVVGNSNSQTLSDRAWMCDANGTRDLGAYQGASRSYASGINDAGVVVGYCGSWSAACYWDSTGLHKLPTLGGLLSAAFAINSSGLMAGYSKDTAGFSWACLWDSTGIQTLPLLPGSTGAMAMTIDDSGQIVGSCYLGSNTVSCIWTPVPEPSSALAIIVALSGLTSLEGRKRRTRQRRGPSR